MKHETLWAIAFAAMMLAGCGGHGWLNSDHFENRANGPRGMHGDPSGTAAGIKQMLRYDANGDGQVGRGEMEAALKRDFAALDKDHDGKLDSSEARAENDRRYAESGTQYSPLLDWNEDGLIDYREFANAARSLFELLDDDHDGVLSPSELKPPHGPTLEEQKKPDQGRGNSGGY